MAQKSDIEGKKIFLLRPHSVIRDDMLDQLIMEGYETYTLLDEAKAAKLLAKFPGSFMFINIDEGLKEEEWENYIRTIQKDPQTKGSRLGIMSYNQDHELMRKYLMELSVPCGYIQLKLGIHESTKIILNALDANEARGKRRHIRVDCQDDISSALNYKGDTGIYHGKILDISAAGIAVMFDKIKDFPPNALLEDVQLRLRGGIVMTNMILMGKRENGVHILLFDPKMTEENKLTIHRYIKLCLRKYIDGLKV